MTRRFKPPVFATTKHGRTTWTLNLGADERDLIGRLLAELRALLTTDDAELETAASAALLQRLFPRVYTDDDEKEAEYQRLMREELVTSRVHQIDAIADLLAGDDDVRTLDEGQVIALMQSTNAVRVVLGTMLDVGEEDDDMLDVDDEHQAERHLYAFMSWLLDWTVRSLPTG